MAVIVTEVVIALLILDMATAVATETEIEAIGPIEVTEVIEIVVNMARRRGLGWVIVEEAAAVAEEAAVGAAAVEIEATARGTLLLSKAVETETAETRSDTDKLLVYPLLIQ